MFLPATCPVCGAVGSAPCERCRLLLRRAPSLPAPAWVDSCAALLSYDGAGREVVARLKYRNARSALGYLAGAMAALVDSGTVDVVTWAPTTLRRRRQRGFDQAQLLARAVARRLGLPCRRLLRRHPGPAQTGRRRQARLGGPAFHSIGRRLNRRVLLVDDVVTSGATVSAAARTLRAGGAPAVHVLAAARTPRRAYTGLVASRAERSLPVPAAPVRITRPGYRQPVPGAGRRRSWM